MDGLSEFFLSVEGRILAIFSRTFLASLFLCLGTQLFDFKKLVPFFSWKRVFSVFFFLLGLRLFWGAFHTF